MKVYRASWCAAAGLIAMSAPVIALVSLPPAGRNVLLLGGLIAGSVTAYADHESRPARRSAARKVRVLVGVVLLFFVVAGVVAASGMYGLVALVLFMALAPPAVRDAVRSPSAPPAEPAHPAQPPEPAWRSEVVAVHALSDEELRVVWRDSGARIGRGGTVDERLHVVRLRETILDELERRDPEGFALTRFRAR